MVEIPTNEPAELRAGNTWKWTRTLADYPAPTWVLHYAFKSATDHFEAQASPSGTDHAIAVLATTTLAIVAGAYTWVAYVESAGERYDVDSGTLRVLTAYANQSVSDDRTHARKVLDALQAAIELKATKRQLDLLTTAFGDRAATRDPKLLMEWLNTYRNLVRSEEMAERVANGEIGGRVLVSL